MNHNSPKEIRIRLGRGIWVQGTHRNISNPEIMGAAGAKAWNHIFPKVEKRVIMFGVDAAGKTTILYKLKLGEIVTTIPTIGFNVESFQYNFQTFTIWDLGLRDKARPLIRHYLDPPPDGLILVVDANAPCRFEEIKDFMEMALDQSLYGCSDLPKLLVLCNKMDLPHAVSAERIWSELGLDRRSRDFKVFIQPCVATTGEGLFEGLDWLTNTYHDKAKGSTTCGQNREKICDRSSA